MGVNCWCQQSSYWIFACHPWLRVGGIALASRHRSSQSWDKIAVNVFVENPWFGPDSWGRGLLGDPPGYSLLFIFVDFMDAGHEMTASSDVVRAECDPSHLGVSSMPATSECGPRDGNPPAGKQTTWNPCDDNVSTINCSFASAVLEDEVEEKDAEDDEQIGVEDADEKADEEGTTAMKLVKAGTAGIGNGSFASAFLEDEVGKKDEEDDKQIDVEDADEKADEEGTTAVMLVKAVKACISNGSFASVMLEDEVEKKDEEDDVQIEVEDADEKVVEEGKPTAKLVKAVNARRCNGSFASALFEDEVEKKDEEDLRSDRS